MDIHWYQDSGIEEAAEAAGIAAVAVWPVLLAKAKAQANGGRIDVTWRELANCLFTTPAIAKGAVEALVSAGVLSCPVVSGRSAELAIDPEAWKRWNEAARKAASRAEEEIA